jgi:hypothetical protein
MNVSMPSDLVFQGDFSFVNVDATSLSTLPHRQQVTRHVHGYRRWKKGQEAKRLRESSKFHENDQQKPAQRQQLAPRPSAKKQQVQPPQADALLITTTLQTLPHLLDVILLDGNSDPFDALPEQLTATVNSLLGFERDCVFPAVKELELRMTAKGNASRETTFTATWIEETKAYLYDTIAIHSYLSRIATNRYMVTSRPEFLDAAHQFRRKGVDALKHYMTTTTNIDILRLYRGLLILLFADCSLGDREAFQTHIDVLRDIFDAHHDLLFKDPAFNLNHFISVIYFEVQHSVMSLTITTLDLSPGCWLDQQFEPLWQRNSQNFLNLQSDAGRRLDMLQDQQRVPTWQRDTQKPLLSRFEADRMLNTYIQGDLRSLHLDAQEVIDTIVLMRTITNLNTSKTWFHAISRLIITVGRLVNFYVSLDVDTVVRHSDMPRASVQTLEQAALALCAIYWLRELGGIESVPMTDSGMRIFTWNPSMLTVLKNIVVACNAPTPDPSQLSPGQLRARIWIFWTCAMAENSLSSTDWVSDGGPRWFTRRFTEIVMVTKVEDQEECVKILDCCLDLHSMRPTKDNGWFEEYFRTTGSTWVTDPGYQ